MFATFIRRLLCVDFQIANSFIAAPPIKPPTSPGPLFLSIRQSISGVNFFPNCCPSATIAAESDGNRMRERPTPPTIAGIVAMTGVPWT